MIARVERSEPPMKRALLTALALLLVLAGVLAAVLVVRTAGMSSRQMAVAPAPALALDTLAAAERLAGAVRIPTVSHSDPALARTEEFAVLHAYLAAAFPQTHAVLQVERVAGYSLLFSWAGADPSLPPLQLMAHQDVVPVEPGTEVDWTYPPFAGVIADGHVWGRGTLDNKGGLVAILEAVETLLAEGFQPRRTVLLAFGHDEEVGGAGAVAIAALLEQRRVRPGLVLDEGGLIAEGLVPGLDAPVALIGTAEKGYLSLELEVRGEGGHSSMPARQTAAGVLARAVARLDERPFPASLRGATRDMFDYLGPEMPFPQRLAFANTWLFAPLIQRQLAATTSTDAAIRTTIAPTMLEGSPKDNVLPSRAWGVVNFRILPGETALEVTERVRGRIGDPRVSVAVHGTASEPSPVSPAGGPVFEALHRTIREIFPDAFVAPYLVLGATDARHFTRVSDHVYRFLPVRATGDDLARFHGSDERVSVRDHAVSIGFYRRLVRNFAG
jgi:carboxypeptidase PM20D1